MNKMLKHTQAFILVTEVTTIRMC